MERYSVVEDEGFKIMVEMIECIEEELEQNKLVSKRAWYASVAIFKQNLTYASHDHIHFWYELLGETNAISRRIK